MHLASTLIRHAPAKVLRSDTVSSIRSKYGYTVVEWEKFKSVTDLTAKLKYADGLPETWTKLGALEQKDIKTRVRRAMKNDLGFKELPQDDLMAWRMEKVFKNMRRTRTAIEARANYIEGHKAVKLGSDANAKAHMRTMRRLVRDIIDGYASKHPDHTWTEIPTHERLNICNHVNAQLEIEKIPTVGFDLLEYQMEIALMTWKIMRNREAGSMAAAGAEQFDKAGKAKGGEKGKANKKKTEIDKKKITVNKDE